MVVGIIWNQTFGSLESKFILKIYKYWFIIATIKEALINLFLFISMNYWKEVSSLSSYRAIIILSPRNSRYRMSIGSDR